MTDEANPVEEKAPVTPLNVILRQEVATRLAESGATVREMVVTELTKAELDKRKAAILSLLEKIDAQQKEIRKAEGEGTVAFDRNGNRVGEPTFTKQQLDSLKQQNEKIIKMQNALGKALESGDFQKVYELTK